MAMCLWRDGFIVFLEITQSRRRLVRQGLELAMVFGFGSSISGFFTFRMPFRGFRVAEGEGEGGASESEAFPQPMYIRPGVHMHAIPFKASGYCSQTEI